MTRLRRSEHLRPSRKPGLSGLPVGWPAVQELLLKHGDLALVLSAAALLAASRADDGENGQRFERGAGDEDALRVGALVGRVDQESFGRGLSEVGGHEGFEDFAVFEAQADPQAFGSRTRGEGLAGERFGVAEFAYEINALDLAQVHGDDRAGSIQQFEFALVDELRRRDVAGDGVPVHLADDYFLVG